MARNRAARLTGACRVFAPVYHQLTTSAIGAQRGDPEAAQAWERAYGDVLDAFKHYLANDNAGRGVVLVGHSQGAGILRELTVAIGAAPGDQRGQDVGGSLGPSWGLRLVDVNLAMGDVVELVAAQGRAHAG